MHTFNPSLGGRGSWISEFNASQVYRVPGQANPATKRGGEGRGEEGREGVGRGGENGKCREGKRERKEIV